MSNMTFPGWVSVQLTPPGYFIGIDRMGRAWIGVVDLMTLAVGWVRIPNPTPEEEKKNNV